MTDALITDQEIAILCDVLEGWRANLNADKRKVLDQLIAKGFVVLTDQEVACKVQNYRQSSTTSRRARRRTKRRLTDVGSAQQLPLAKFVATRRASSRVSRLVAERRCGLSSN